MAKTNMNFNNAKVLIVDDVPANIDVLMAVLEKETYNVLVATSGVSSLKVAETEQPDLILLDVVMPEMNGYETCRTLKANTKTKNIPVIFVTSRSDVEGIMEGFRAGAIDYVIKPFHKEEVVARIRTHLERTLLMREVQKKNIALEKEIAKRQALDNRLTMISQREAEHWGIQGFIGKSEMIKKILHNINLLKNVDTVSVLITGESGTGKELIARAVHAGSSRAKGPFVPLNCSTIPNELAESQLFGHVKGAFTGADKNQSGYFELADGGTLFLDEIGTMPKNLQPKLLRVLEDGMIRRLGTTTDRKVDVRIIAATNASPETFREDLYFRLARYTVEMPPLRNRKEDIPLLAQHFVHLFANEMGIEHAKLSADALEWLSEYHYPGNVRELKNIVERALIESGGAKIKVEHLHGHKTPELRSSSDITSSTETKHSSEKELPLNLDEAERILVERALEQTKGNVSQAANLLGIDRNKIYRIQSRDKEPSN
jgi:DNA-binding NtrC family response regulator